MILNFTQVAEMYFACQELQEMKMPFKLSIILAKNIAALKTEYDFYVEREREFALKYLEIDEETGNFKQLQEGVFKIKDGFEEECKNARIELNNFETEVNLRKIPVALLENLDFSPKTLMVLESLIEEEE